MVKLPVVMALKPPATVLRRCLFYAIFTCTCLMICPVIGMVTVEPPPEPSVNSTAPDANDLRYYIHIWGLWGPESWQCETLYNTMLEDTSEFNKGGSNSASTIVALLPSLIAFTPVVTANIGFLCHLSPSQGFIAAAFTFGLPVRQQDTWKLASIRVKDLLVDSQPRHDNVITVLRPFTEMVDILLAPIKYTALRSRRPRRILVRFLNFFLYSVQGTLLVFLLAYVPGIDTIFLIWLCPDWGSVVFGLWLGGTFTLVGWWRAKFERDSFGGDEVIYISKALSTSIYRQRFLGPHPMIVILRPSHNVLKNHQHNSYFIGMLQLFWLCFLSFLFSSTIGGTLFRTLIMVVAFISVVGISRGLSILAGWLAQKYLDLRVIEYDDLEEKRMVQRLLGGLTGVLVDIRWLNYKKTEWQESVKMYRWGNQLSRGNVAGVLDDTKPCTIHAQKEWADALMDSLVRAAAITYCILMAIVLAILGAPAWADPRVVASRKVQLGAGLIIIVASAISVLHLGRTKRLSICNCTNSGDWTSYTDNTESVSLSRRGAYGLNKVPVREHTWVRG